MTLLNRTAYDEAFYREELFDFLPDTFIDCHTHIWKNEFLLSPRDRKWTSFVAEDNPMEDLIATNEELFPGKKCIPVVYPMPITTMDVKKNNEYTLSEAKKHHLPALYLSRPEEPAEHVKEEILKGGYAGLKVYLNYAPSYIPSEEIRIYDFLPKEQLKVLDELGKVVQLHIARSKRLADPVNYVQIREIEEQYPNLTLIVAHLGRAYADADVGNAIEYLKDTKKTIWDFTANTNQHVMELCLDAFGPKRFIYGSDFPIFRMKARRTVENDVYINEVPEGSLGNLDGVAHMREIPYPEAEKITFFIYEEMAACKRAVSHLGLGKKDIEDIFYNNSARLFGVER